MRVFTKARFPLHPRWQRLAVLLLCASVGLAQAQSANDDAAADPPSRVARLSYMEGDLGFLPAGANDWIDASINRPLTTGDRLSTGQNARAELELGGGALRIAGQTDFGLLNLNDQLAQIELTQGTLNISVRYLDPGQSYEIDTPTVALVVDRPGTFRVDIDSNGQSTEVTALNGNATVYGENSAQRPIDAGHRYRFDDSGLINGTITDISGGDAFDAWCSHRDLQYAQSSTNQYVSQDVVGYQDLAQYGNWDSDSDYGAVWYPSNVDSDWAPYQDGSWAYIAPWGWSWIDNSRWGFAPYHYGRWAHTHRGWGWIPGPIGVRPIYAPALVAFVDGGGWRSGSGRGGRPGYVGLGGAGPVHPIGWFPLGPGEIYNPWYHGSRRYYNDVNISNIRVISNNRTALINNINNQYGHYRNGTSLHGEHYVNRDAPHGFTAVPGAAFTSGRNVRSQRLQLDPSQMTAAPVLTRGSSLRPAAASTTLPQSDHARALPLNGFQRNVVARQAPPAATFGHRAGSINNPTAPRRAGSANVKVLSQHFGNGPVADPTVATPAASGRDMQANPRSFGSSSEHQTRTLPVASHIIPSTPPTIRQESAPQHAPYPNTNNAPAQASRAQSGTAPNNLIPARLGELPSARYAHPHAGAGDMPVRGANPRESMQRPGVSYISNGNDNPSRPISRPTGTLPQVPQIQRVTSINRPMPQQQPRAMPQPASQYYAPRYQRPVYQQPAPQYIQPQQQMSRPQQAQPRAQPRPAERAVRADDKH